MSHLRGLRRSARRALPAALAALGVLVLCGAAWGQSDLRQDGSGNASAKPIVLVLLDTSGSMEYLRAEGEFPDCDSGLLTAEGRPRQAIAKEVLAGRIEQLTCVAAARPGVDPDDRDNQLPHFALQSNYGPLRRTRETGLLHINRELVRFGFMSFDSEQAGGDLTSFTSNPGTPLPESNLWNLGIRSPNAPTAPLIDVGDLSKPQDGILRAAQIEDAVVSFFPYGQTPLAAMFRDVKKYLEEQAASDQELGLDPFKDCRPIEIVLISDGEPTGDDCVAGQPNAGTPRCVGYPYRTALQELAELVTSTNIPHRIRVHVVGFNTEDNSPCRGAGNITVNGQSLPNAACVHQLAMVGGTDSNSDPNDDVFAYVANNQIDLTRQLTRVLANIVAGISARTRTTSTSRTSFREENAGRYQFSAAFGIDADSHLWKGILERRTFQCVGGALQTQSVVNFADALANPANRVIYTPLFDPNQSAHPDDGGYLTRNGRRLIKINDTPTALYSTINLAALNRIFGANTYTGLDFAGIVAILEGRGVRSGRPMGDIFHSNPIISGGPELSLEIAGYQRFSDYFATRKTAVFVGSNDGQLHAFNAEVTDANISQGHLWSYLPQELQRKVYLQHATRVYGVDASPLVRDVRLFRGAAAPGDVVDPVGNANLDNIGFYDIWGTILIGGLRGGGRAFFALDVSEPLQPRFLWELNPASEQRRLDDSKPNEFQGTGDKTLLKPLLGLSYGQPGIGTVLMSVNGANVERGIAILPGGVPEDPSVTSPPEAVRQGRALYIVDISTGRVLRRITRVTQLDGTVTDIDAAITGDIGAFDDFPGNLLTRAFVGDAKGRLLRLDLRSTNPADWALSVFHDSGTNNPIYLKPSMAFNNSSELIVLYGSGDIDNLEQREGVNKLFSLREKQVINPLTGAISGVTSRVNWELSFPNSEKLTGSPLIYNSVAYFPTFVPNSAACSYGKGRVYAVDFDGAPELDDEDNNLYVTNDIIGKLDSNDEQFADPNLNLTLDNTTAFFELPDNAIVFGLEIAQQPACTPDIPDNFGQLGVDTDPINPSSLNPPLELIAQTGAGQAVQGGPGQGSVINTLRFRLERPPSSIFPISWSAILD